MEAYKHLEETRPFHVVLLLMELSVEFVGKFEVQLAQ